MKMDAFNFQILELLQKNGRISYKDISDILKKSESTVRDRIQNLERAQVIKGYTAILDRIKLGYHTDAILFCNLLPNNKIDAISELQKIDYVNQIFHISGERRIAIRLIAQDATALEQLIKSSIIPLGFINLDLHIILDSIEKIECVSHERANDRGIKPSRFIN